MQYVFRLAVIRISYKPDLQPSQLCSPPSCVPSTYCAKNKQNLETVLLSTLQCCATRQQHHCTVALSKCAV